MAWQHFEKPAACSNDTSQPDTVIARLDRAIQRLCCDFVEKQSAAAKSTGTLKIGQQFVAQLRDNALKNLPACANDTSQPNTVIARLDRAIQRLYCDSIEKQHEKLPGIKTSKQELKEMGNGE